MPNATIATTNAITGPTLTVQDFLNRRAAYFEEPRLEVKNIGAWVAKNIEDALVKELPSGNLKHISASLTTGSRKVSCRTNLSVQRTLDILDPWTFEMMYMVGRTDLCLSCMRRQRTAWEGFGRITYCSSEVGMIKPSYITQQAA